MMCVYSVAGVAAALPAARRAINRLTPKPTNIAVTVDRHISAIMYGSAVPTTVTRRMAVRGAPSKSPSAADSMHSTRMDYRNGREQQAQSQSNHRTGEQGREGRAAQVPALERQSQQQGLQQRKEQQQQHTVLRWILDNRLDLRLA